MPLYEYHCDACDNDFEANQRMSDDPLSTCTQCGKEGQVKRLLSSGNGLIFKGSGFYITDYKNSNSGGGEKAPASTSESSTSEKSSESKSTATESKPAAASSSGDSSSTTSSKASSGSSKD